MTESENTHLSFDNLPRSVAELHEKIDRLTGMLEQIISSTAVTPLPEIMTVEDVSAMLCKSVSTIYAMTSEHRIPYRKQVSPGNPIVAYGCCCSERYSEAQKKAAG